MDDDFTEDCQWARCRAPGELIYFDVGLCMDHWNRACADSEKRGCSTSDVVFEHITAKAKDAMLRKAEEWYLRHVKGATGS